MEQNVQNSINSFAEAVRAYFSIAGPIDDIQNFVECDLGGQIIEKDDIDEFSAGYIIKNDDSFCIFVPKGQIHTRRNFTIAHEIGHLFLHMGYMTNKEKWMSQDNIEYHRHLFRSSTQEIQANEFAAAFLMPRYEFLNKLNEYTTGDSVQTDRVADYFHVSIEAASNRGKELGYFDW